MAVHIERIVTGGKKQADMLMEEEETIIKMQIKKGTWYHSWSRHCGTNWEVAGSIPDLFEILIFPTALWPWRRPRF